MFFKKSSNIIFRKYDSFGYVTDNRNFGYKRKNENKNDIGDKIISKSGAIFFSVLDDTPKHIDSIAKEICKFFDGIDIETIKNDAREFYLSLENDRFIVSGKTPDECKSKDVISSYKNSTQPIQINQTQTDSYQEKTPQDFLEEYFHGKPQLTNIHIEITSKCDERCIHCYIPHENKTSEINHDLFYNILKQSREMGVLHLTLSGGEPMLHKNFLEFIAKCREYNFSVNILSNLTLLNDDIIQEMKKNPLLGVQTSLYSMNNHIHDRITQRIGSFEETKNAILKLIEKDITVQISCPIMIQNKDCYNDVIEWADEHNIYASADPVIIARYDNTTKNLSCRLSVDDIKELVCKKSTYNKKYLEQIKRESENKNDITPDDPVCSVCTSSICITENGDVYPCAGWQGYVVGNIKENFLNDIWEHSEKIIYLRTLCKRDFPKCIQCPDRKFCTMCMVRNANEDPFGDPLKINEYFCGIAKFYKNFLDK